MSADNNSGTIDPALVDAALIDVAVIGMGPVGKMAALLLARAGHDVLVVDRREVDYPLPRAVGHDAEIARLLQLAGLRVDAMPEAVEPYDDLYVWVNAAQETLEQIDVSGVGSSGWNNMYFYHQPALEARMDDALRALPGITVRRGMDAHVTGQDDESVDLLLTPVSGGIPEKVRARFVLGADGANSTTRRDAGIGWHDLGYFFDWLVVDVIPGPDAEITHLAKQVCDPLRPTTVVPAGPGRRRWEFMLLEGDDRDDLVRPERIWELLAPFGVTPGRAKLDRGVIYTFAAGWAESWRTGRVFLLGDAAHLMPPFAAQGLASGFRDCLNLAWKLDLVLHGVSDRGLLGSYQSERLSHVDGFIQFSMALGQVICITDPTVAAHRDAQMTAALQARTRPAPPPAPRLGPGLHLGEHGGELSRQGFITTAGRPQPTRFDDVFGPGALLVRSQDPVLPPTLVRALRDIGITVAAFGPSAAGSLTRFDDCAGTYAGWFQEWSVAAVLVRPDFSVFGAAKDARDTQTLAQDYLAAVHHFTGADTTHRIGAQS